MKIGVVIVIYDSADVIVQCLDSLAASQVPVDRIVLYDNASPDQSVDVIETWATGAGLGCTTHDDSRPDQVLDDVNIVRSSLNRGFAGGVNGGIKAMMADGVDLFWILNPDAIIKTHTVGAIMQKAQEIPNFGLMSGRVTYVDPEGIIQVDGGHIRKWTGVCESVNLGFKASETALPDASQLSYLSGAHLIASRKFIETVGLMKEDYFLYFEEVDWAMRRGDLPLVICEQADILHHGGTSIGSGTEKRQASGFANYFNYRNRRRFMWRFYRRYLPTTLAESTARIIQMVLKGHRSEAWGAFCGLAGLPPPASIRQRIAKDSQPLAFAAMDRHAGTVRKST